MEAREVEVRCGPYNVGQIVGHVKARDTCPVCDACEPSHTTHTFMLASF